MLPASAPTVPQRYAEHLPARVERAWHALGSYDRRHLVAVAAELEASGHSWHVVMAGLLHDIGKAGRVRLIDRVALVLLSRLAPAFREHLAARTKPAPGLEGLHLLLRHAERGADLLADAGMPAEVVWLVRHHERVSHHVELRALQEADHRL